SVFGRDVAVVHRHRRVVGSCDGYAHGGNPTVERTVIGLVSETVAAQVVGRREVAEPAVRVQGQDAVSRLTDQDGAQGIPVHVTVIGQHTDGRYVEDRVFQRGVAVIDRHGRVIHACNRDAHRGNAAAERAV